MRKIICVAAIQNGEILLVRKNGTLILPGGKPEGIESEHDCLVREFKEELPKMILKNLRFYDSGFSGITPHSKVIRIATVYVGNVSGELYVGAEIDEAQWVVYPKLLPLSEITKKIICSLYQTGHL